MRLLLCLAILTLTACSEDKAPAEPKALQSYWYSSTSGVGWYDLDLSTPDRATFYYDDGGVCACDAIVSETSFAASNCVSTAPADCSLGVGVATFAFTPGALQIRMDNNALCDLE